MGSAKSALPIFFFESDPGLEGSKSPLRSGRRKAEVHRTSCAPSRANANFPFRICLGLEGSKSPFHSGLKAFIYDEWLKLCIFSSG